MPTRFLKHFSIWLTIDGGTNWRKVFPSGPNRLEGQPTRGYFDSESAVVAATNGKIYRTKDRGENWEVQTLASNTHFDDVHFITKHIGWLFGYIGGQRGTQLYKTTDGGQELDQTTLGEIYIESICFLNENEGWAAGIEPVPGPRETIRGTVLRTNNGGGAWNKLQALPNDQSFDHIQFVDSQTGWLIWTQRCLSK